MRLKFLPLYRKLLRGFGSYKAPPPTIQGNSASIVIIDDVEPEPPITIPEPMFAPEPENEDMPHNLERAKASPKAQVTAHLKVLMSFDVPLELRTEAARQLRLRKRTSKKSWEVLGVDDRSLALIDSLLAKEDAKPKPSRKMKALSAKLHRKL
jgi:hypothetical protein